MNTMTRVRVAAMCSLLGVPAEIRHDMLTLVDSGEYPDDTVLLVGDTTKTPDRAAPIRYDAMSMVLREAMDRMVDAYKQHSAKAWAIVTATGMAQVSVEDALSDRWADELRDLGPVVVFDCWRSSTAGSTVMLVLTDEGPVLLTDGPQGTTCDLLR